MFRRGIRETEDHGQIRLRNVSCCLVGPFDKADRIAPEILAQPCIVKLFWIIEPIKIKVIQV